jgi:hypothetical protein
MHAEITISRSHSKVASAGKQNVPRLLERCLLHGTLLMDQIRGVDIPFLHWEMSEDSSGPAPVKLITPKETTSCELARPTVSRCVCHSGGLDDYRTLWELL